MFWLGHQIEIEEQSVCDTGCSCPVPWEPRPAAAWGAEQRSLCFPDTE